MCNRFYRCTMLVDTVIFPTPGMNHNIPPSIGSIHIISLSIIILQNNDMSKRTASDISIENSMSKRTASDISSDSFKSKRTASDISTTPGALATLSTPSIQHPSLRDQCSSANHYIRQTFLGPICTKCNTKISLLGTLFTISSKTIIRHWKRNNCYVGDIKNLNAKELEKSLHISITQLYKTIHNNPTLATKIVRGQFHSNTIRQSPYCSRCGYVGITRNVRRHIQNDAYNCTSVDANIRGGKVLTDKYQFCIPQDVLDTISSGNFQLPFDHHTNTIIMVQTSNESDGHTSISSLKSSSASILMDTIIHTPSKFLPKDDEIEDLCLPDSTGDDAASFNSFAMAELLDCFGNEENATIMAREILTSFILLIDQTFPGSLRNTLYGISTMMTTSITNPNLRMLLNAGKSWLTSDSANMDVRMVPVHHRNAIYLVGNSFTEKDKDLLKGCTFVWSDCVDSILQQFASLITYAYESQWPIMSQYLGKVDKVYHCLLQNDTTDKDIDKLEADATNKIVNSRMIGALLSDLLMENPAYPNAPNCIYHYLAGMCVISSAHSKKLSLRSANGISRSSNACLRLLRHGVCSLYVHKSVQMTQQMKSDADFQVWVNDFLREMQGSSSVGHICRTIRTAREVDRKSPSSVYKAFNDTTGDLFVDGNEIFKSSWSVAIPTACQEWDKHLMFLFPNHSSSSSALPLQLVFNLKNHIVLAEEDSCIYIDNSAESSIPLSEYQPNFPQ